MRTQAEQGIIEETSTSVLFGATFTIAAFQGRLCGRQSDDASFTATQKDLAYIEIYCRLTDANRL
jgi:hypothetical protein